MSYDLGHNRSYINNISSGKSMPSMVEFFAICDYLGVTPKDFFDDKRENPALTSELETAIQSLDDESAHLILSLINKINNQKE
jgi:transcriptional regulator with XRE-family HTH domain